MICGITLALVSLPWFGFSNTTQLTVILLVVFCTGIIRSFAGPSANSMIAAIVPREQLQKAISYNSSTWLISSIGGHAIGGLLIAGIGISNAYFVTAALVLTAGIFALQLFPKPPVQNLEKEPMLTSIKKGFSFVFSNKNLLGVISLDLFAVLFGGASAFIPEVASTILHTNAVGYGFLNAAMDLGSLIIVALLVKYPMRRKQGLKMLLAVAGFGICIIIFGLSKVYWLSFMALLAAGLCDAVSVVVRGTILQLFTPDELRGRVSSINLIFINSSNELGQFESGVTSRMFGTLPAIIFGGAMSVLVVTATWLKFPKLRKLEF
jgi:MFS family permease